MAAAAAAAAAATAPTASLACTYLEKYSQDTDVLESTKSESKDSEVD